MRPYKGLLVRSLRHHTSEEIENASVENENPPRRYKKILPNFYFILPKFHSILPNFYFGPPWRIFISSVAIGNFLGRDWDQRRWGGVLV